MLRHTALSLLNAKAALLKLKPAKKIAINATATVHHRFFATQVRGDQRISVDQKINQLIVAVRENDFDTISTLAKSDPKLITMQTVNDNSAMHEAARTGKNEMIDFLSSTFPDHVDFDHKCHCTEQRTYLHYAVDGGHFESVENLLRKGANPNISDEKGRTPLDYALEKNNAKIAAILIEKGAKANKMKAKGEELMPAISAQFFAKQYLSGTSLKANAACDELIASLSTAKSKK
jgi:ankyrin repeat protein